MADLDLARRAVACPGWRWMPGMLAIPQSGVYGGPADAVRVYWIHPEPRGVEVPKDAEQFGPWGMHMGGNRWPLSMHGPYLPDLDDPATLGCLLALVREAWGDPQGAVAYDGRWRWFGSDGRGVPVADTEAAALVAALEAAPPEVTRG